MVEKWQGRRDITLALDNMMSEVSPRDPESLHLRGERRSFQSQANRSAAGSSDHAICFSQDAKDCIAFGGLERG